MRNSAGRRSPRRFQEHTPPLTTQKRRTLRILLTLLAFHAQPARNQLCVLCLRADAARALRRRALARIDTLRARRAQPAPQHAACAP